MSDYVPIVGLAARGDGVTPDGRFVPGSVTGDAVRFDPFDLRPGPNHATPSCRHFGDCGGCQLQHVTDAAYAQWATARITKALGAVGIVPAEIAPFALSPPCSRRRVSLRAERRGGRVTLGFNADASHRIVDIQQCTVMLPELFALVAPLRRLLGGLLMEGQGAGIALTQSDTGIDVLLAGVAARKLAAIEALTVFAEHADLARLSVESEGGVETIVAARPPVIHFDGAAVALPPAPFLQATREGEVALQAAVVEAVGDAAAVADLFCGLGTFTLPLAATAKVYAADAGETATAALRDAARGRPVLVEQRDLFRRPLEPLELRRFDAVVFDPPRAGAAVQAAQLAASNVPIVVAVSCNPNTFARDAAVLVAGGFRCRQLWPVGQFRWSTHVELVACFAR